MLRRTLICSLCALLLAGPASAGDIVVKLGLAPGKLQATVAKTSDQSIVIRIADGRGSGAGWTLRASKTVSVASVTARCAAGSTCTLPRAGSRPAANVVLRAAPDSGMGVIELNVTLERPSPAGVTFQLT